MFGSTFTFESIFGGIFAEGKRLKEEAIKERLGIICIDGKYGSDYLSIPYKYDYVSINGKVLEFHLSDSDQKDIYLIQETNVLFLFRCFKYDYLGCDMYLVSLEERGKYALFNKQNNLTEFKYDSHRFDKWVDNEDFAVLHYSAPTKYSVHVIVNKQGEEIIECDGFSTHVHLAGNVACLDKFWYNLLTLEKICSKTHKSYIECDEFIFVECGKNSVYKISKLTGEFELFGIPDEGLKEKPNVVYNTTKQKAKSTPPSTPIQNRNEPCSCGSGLKFKKCCLKIKIG